MDETLFNGDYYQQKVEFQDLRDKSFAQSIAHVDEKSSEMQQLLKREGPKVSVRLRMPVRRRHRRMDGWFLRN